MAESALSFPTIQEASHVLSGHAPIPPVCPHVLAVFDTIFGSWDVRNGRNDGWDWWNAPIMIFIINDIIIYIITTICEVVTACY